MLEHVRGSGVPLLHLSTSGVYGAVQDRPGFTAALVDEDVPPDPKSFYACLHHADETASTDPGGKADLRPLQGLLTTVLKQQLQS